MCSPRAGDLLWDQQPRCSFLPHRRKEKVRNSVFKAKHSSGNSNDDDGTLNTEHKVRCS